MLRRPFTPHLHRPAPVVAEAPEEHHRQQQQHQRQHEHRPSSSRSNPQRLQPLSARSLPFSPQHLSPAASSQHLQAVRFDSGLATASLSSGFSHSEGDGSDLGAPTGELASVSLSENGDAEEHAILSPLPAIPRKGGDRARGRLASSSSSSSLSSSASSRHGEDALQEGGDASDTGISGISAEGDDGGNDDIVWVNQGSLMSPLSTPRAPKARTQASPSSSPMRASASPRPPAHAASAERRRSSSAPPARGPGLLPASSSASPAAAGSIPVHHSSHADGMWDSILGSLQIGRSASRTSADLESGNADGSAAGSRGAGPQNGWVRVRDQLVSSGSHRTSTPVAPMNLETLATLDIFMATWNMNKQDIPQDLDALLHPRGRLSHHIYIVGTQEGSMARRAWELKLRATLGPQYVLAHSHALGVIQLCCLIRQDILPAVSKIESAHVATKMGGVMQTKGGVGICFDFRGTSFLFIDSHLAAHQSNIKDRNSDFRTICRNLGLPHTDRIKSELAMTPLRSRSGV
jgi:hypothetical protein